MRTKKFQKSRQTFRSVGHSVCNFVGTRADGHVSDMHGPSVSDVGNAVGNRANGHVSDMREDNPSVIPSVFASEKPSESRR